MLLEQAQHVGARDGLSAAVYTKLAVNALNMCFNGSFGDDEVPGYFLIRHACC